MNRSSVKLWGSAMLAAACLTIPATSFAGILSNKERVSLIEPAEPRIHGNATFGAFGSDQGFRGSFEALAPLAFDGNQLLFLYPEFMADDEGAQFYSIGLGYRVLLDQPKVILGANIFYDNGESPYDNRIHRLGLGAEVLGERFSARINYYFSDGDEHLIDSRTLTSSSSSSKVVGRSSSAGPITRSPGGTFQSVTTATKIRTTTTTTSRTFERFEQGMDGLDAELGFQIPLPEKLQRLPELWLYAGYYNYNSDYGRDLDGFKARAELRFGDRFTVDAAYYEDDGLIGSHWLAGARVHIPFGGGYEAPVGWAGRRGVMTASAEPYGDGASSDILMSRMTENIIRDGKTYTSQSDFIENPDLRRVSRRSRTTERISTSLRQLEISADIIFVDGANTESGDGSFDNPFQNLTLAQSEAQTRATDSGLEQTIYVFDTSPGYEEAVTFNGSGIAGFRVNLLDSSNPITFEGTPIGGADPKTQWTAPIEQTPLVLTNIDQFELSGFNISSQGADALVAQNVGSLVLNDTMLNAMPGTALHLDGVAQVVANNVSVDTAGGAEGVRITNSGGPAPSTLNFANANIANKTNAGVFLANNTGRFGFGPASIGNGRGAGIDILGGDAQFTFNGVDIADSGSPALRVDAGSSAILFDNGSTITQNNHGASVHVLGGHSGSLAFAPGTSIEAINRAPLGFDNGPGLRLENADGIYDFQGQVTLEGGDVGINILNGSDGTFTFASTDIADSFGPALHIGGGAADVTFGPGSSISNNRNVAVVVTDNHNGTLLFAPGSSITVPSGRDSLRFAIANGTYNFEGMVDIVQGSGIDILASAGTFTFANTAITDPGTALNIHGGSANVTFSGPSSITQSTPFTTVSVGGGHTGTLTFAPTSTITATNGDGLQFDNADGTYNFNGTTTLNGGDAGIDIIGGSAGTFTFSSATNITNPTATALNIANLEAGGRVDYLGSITNNFDTILSIDTTAAGSSVNLIDNSGNSLTSANNPNGAIFIFDADGDITITTPTTVTDADFSALFATDGDGTWTFNDMTITDQHGLNGGIDVFGNMGTVNFTNLNITTDSAGTGDAATGFLAGGNNSINVFGNSSVDADGGSAVVLVNINQVDMTWQTLTSTNNTNAQVGFAGNVGVDLLNVGAGTFSVTGTTTIDNADDVGISVEGSGATVTFADVAISNIGLNGILSGVAFDNTGTININGGTVDNTGSDGVRIGSNLGNGVTGGFNLNNTTFTNIGDSVIEVGSSTISGAGNIAVPFSSNNLGGNNGTILFNDGADSAP